MACHAVLSQGSRPFKTFISGIQCGSGCAEFLFVLSVADIFFALTMTAYIGFFANPKHTARDVLEVFEFQVSIANVECVQSPQIVLVWMPSKCAMCVFVCP